MPSPRERMPEILEEGPSKKDDDWRFEQTHGAKPIDPAERKRKIEGHKKKIRRQLKIDPDLFPGH